MKAPDDSVGGAEPIFSTAELEQLSFRRYNPLATLNAASLTSALDGFLAGDLPAAARLWARLGIQQKTIRNVKAKREQSVALRKRLIERTDDSPEAYDQQAVLEHFYANSRASHALKRNVHGKFSKLVTQMMEAKSFGTATHHLIWTPNSSMTVTLPSGKKVPGLTAQFEYVPLEFFESRTGELRFLGMDQGWTGKELRTGEWLITSEEAPLMFAASPLAYYDKIATADLINFSDKFGTPGLVIHTTAQKDTPEGKAAFALGKSLASNYRGVNYGAQENKVEIVWPSGGTSGTSLPMHTIIEDTKRDLASLFLGADLSTQSRAENAVGASVQQEGEEARMEADCAWISETLNAGIDPIVIRWYFGDVPVLARVVIDAPKKEDLTALSERVSKAVELGAEVPIEPVMQRMGIPLAKKGEKVFENRKEEKPPKHEETKGKRKTATNSAVTCAKCGAKFEPSSEPETRMGAVACPSCGTNILPTGELATDSRPDPQLTGLFLARCRDLIGEAAAADMRVLREAIENVLADEEQFTERVEALYAQLPDLSDSIIEAMGNAEALYQVFSVAAAENLATEKSGLAVNAVRKTPQMQWPAGTILNGVKVGGTYRPSKNALSEYTPDKPEDLADAEVSASQLDAGTSKRDVLKNELIFNHEILEHWKGKEPNDILGRLKRLPQAFAAVQKPHEIWRQGSQTHYLQIFANSKGQRYAQVFTTQKGKVHSYLITDKLERADEVRHGERIYVRE